MFYIDKQSNMTVEALRLYDPDTNKSFFKVTYGVDDILLTELYSDTEYKNHIYPELEKGFIALD